MSDLNEEVVDMDLDLDSVDLDDVDLSDVDMSNFGEVDENIEFPHIKVSSKQLKEFLKVSKKICQLGGKDILSKSVCLVYDKVSEKVQALSTNFDVYLKQDMECLNTENVLEEALIIPTDILIKLCSAVPANTILYKKDDVVYIRLYAGDLEVETYSVDQGKFIYQDEVEKVTSVDATELYGVLKDMSPIVAAAVNPVEKRIFCEDSGAYANYLFAIIKSDGSFGKYDLKSKDIDVLKGLIANKKDEMLTVSKTKEDVKIERCVIAGSDFMYAFLVSDSEISPTLKSKMEEVVKNDGVYVDFIQFYKSIELASELPYALGKVNVNYTDTGVSVDIVSKKGTSNIFNIDGSSQGDVKELEKPLVVQAKLLRVVLRSFVSKSSIKLTVSDKGLGIEADTYKACLYSEA